MSPQSAKTLCALAIIAASHSAMAQSGPNLLGRKFISPSDMASVSNPMEPASATSQAQQQQDVPALPAVSASPAQAPAAPARQAQAPAQPMAPAVATPAQQPALAPQPAPLPRYVADTSYNMGSLSSKASDGAKLDSKMIGAYAARAPKTTPASSSREGMKATAPSVAILRSLGVEQGKIDMELNRLTPSQFQRWAEEASR